MFRPVSDLNINSQPDFVLNRRIRDALGNTVDGTHSATQSTGRTRQHNRRDALGNTVDGTRSVTPTTGRAASALAFAVLCERRRTRGGSGRGGGAVGGCCAIAVLGGRGLIGVGIRSRRGCGGGAVRFRVAPRRTGGYRSEKRTAVSSNDRYASKKPIPVWGPTRSPGTPTDYASTSRTSRSSVISATLSSWTA